MKVLSLIVPAELPYQVGSCLGEGADGEVRELPDPEKIIKLSIIYDLDYSGNIYNNYKSLSKIYSSIKKENDSCLAKIYDFGFVCSGERTTVLGAQDYLIHYCVMEKLFKISEDEKKVFHTILSHEDSEKYKKYSAPEIEKILNNLRRGLDFSKKEVKFFHEQFCKLKYHYSDIHVRNIMKTKLGQFKLIDFDRIK